MDSHRLHNPQTTKTQTETNKPAKPIMAMRLLQRTQPTSITKMPKL